MLKNPIISVLILLLSNGCTKVVSPRLTTIEPMIRPLPNRDITYSILGDGNVTLRVEDAKWLIGKLNRCVKNHKKLEIANRALNEEIRVNNLTYK